MTLDEYKHQKLMKRELAQLDKREEKAIALPKTSYLQEKTGPLLEKISDNIPDVAINTLKKSFQKGFSLVFEKGSGLIGKTFSEEAKLKHFNDVSGTEQAKPLSRWSLSKLDFQIKSTAFANTAFSATEGAALGVLGVGMPDVLILLSIVFKTLYEISLSYGFNYRGNDEQIFQLLVISAALGEAEHKKNASLLAKQAGEALFWGNAISISKEEAEALAADALCNAMLTGKLIQGIPIIGAYGGISNGQILSKLSEMATIQYKRRMLLNRG